MDARLYADDRWVRSRQVAGDAVVLGLTWVAVRTARRVSASITELRAVAEGLDRSGRTVTDAATRASDAAEAVPAVGGALAVPFRALGGAGGELSAVGDHVGRTVDTVAFWLPVLVVVAVVGFVLLRYLPARIGWVREASQARRLLAHPDASQLLGVRAAASRPLAVLCREVDDPAAALAEGRWDELAAVELRALGLDRLHLTPGPAEAA